MSLTLEYGCYTREFPPPPPEPGTVTKSPQQVDDAELRANNVLCAMHTGLLTERRSLTLS